MGAQFHHHNNWNKEILGLILNLFLSINHLLITITNGKYRYDAVTWIPFSVPFLAFGGRALLGIPTFVRYSHRSSPMAYFLGSRTLLPVSMSLLSVNFLNWKYRKNVLPPFFKSFPIQNLHQNGFWIKPRALGTQHRAQGTKPSDPGTKPRDPGAKPRDYQSDLGILGQNLVIQGPNLGTHDGTKPSYCLYCSGSGFGGGRIILPVCSSIDPCCRLAVRPWGYRRCPQSNPNLWWPQKSTSRSWTSWAGWKSWPWACPQQWVVNRTSRIGKTHWKNTHTLVICKIKYYLCHMKKLQSQRIWLCLCLLNEVKPSFTD